VLLKSSLFPFVLRQAIFATLLKQKIYFANNFDGYLSFFYYFCFLYLNQYFKSICH